MRNVRRQKVASASLFDQRRMRIQNSNNRNVNNNGSSGSSNGITGSKNVKYSALQQKNSMDAMETIELTEGHPTPRTGKIPKSPAPDTKLMEMV